MYDVFILGFSDGGWGGGTRYPMTTERNLPKTVESQQPTFASDRAFLIYTAPNISRAPPARQWCARATNRYDRLI